MPLCTATCVTPVGQSERRNLPLRFPRPPSLGFVLISIACQHRHLCHRQSRTQVQPGDSMVDLKPSSSVRSPAQASLIVLPSASAITSGDLWTSFVVCLCDRQQKGIGQRHFFSALIFPDVAAHFSFFDLILGSINLRPRDGHFTVTGSSKTRAGQSRQSEQMRSRHPLSRTPGR